MQVGALRARLESEHTAHEAANVQAILGSAAAVPRVIAAINGAGDRLSDLGLTLDMFDGKLASMRDDIGSIETRNNSLETQARSLERLRAATVELLHTLSVRFLPPYGWTAPTNYPPGPLTFRCPSPRPRRRRLSYLSTFTHVTPFCANEARSYTAEARNAGLVHRQMIQIARALTILAGYCGSTHALILTSV